MSNRKKKQPIDSNMYCLSCRQQTGTSSPKVVQTANGKYRMTGQCNSCGNKKSKFISSQTGQGILGNLLGLPGGKIPMLGDLPILGALF